MHRVLYLSPGLFDKGGISRYGRFQTRALRDLLGTENVHALSLVPPDGLGFEQPFPVQFASLGANPPGKALFGAAAAMTVARVRPTIVVCAHLYLGPLALPLARAAGATYVQDVYGTEVWTNLHWHRARVLAAADHLVSDCHATLDHLLRHRRRGTAGNHVHWDCVDTGRYAPGDPGDVLVRYGARPADHRALVLTLGRIAPETLEYKGYRRLLDAFATLRELPVRLLFAGSGPSREVLRDEIRQRGLEDTAEVIGPVHEDDLPSVYRACDLFSLVTHSGIGAGEGIPLTPLEAASCGKPILVGDQDGSKEAVEHGVTGFVLRTFDKEALVERIRELATDPARRREMGERGRARMLREHSYERFRERTRELLEAIGPR
jgi:phosphatidylinositol alpha-1,6-mannosyltransferase